jgi:hypothetical protein
MAALSHSESELLYSGCLPPVIVFLIEVMSNLCYNWWSVGQYILVSSPHLGPKTRFLSLSDSCGFVDVGHPLWREEGLSFTIAAGPHQRSHSQVQVPQDSWPYFAVSDLWLCNLEGHIPVFISPRNRVALLYPQTLHSLFVTSYDLQACGGGIWTCVHAGIPIENQNQSQSYIMINGQSASLSWFKASFGAQDQTFVTLRQLQVCWCRAPSLTKEQVCSLQLLLAITSAVILGSESHRTHDHMLLSQIRDSCNLEGQVPIFSYPPGTGCPNYTPNNWILFLSPPVTHSAMVEVFEPISTQASPLIGVKVSVTLQPTVNLPVYLGVKPHLGPKTIEFLCSLYTYIALGRNQ